MYVLGAKGFSCNVGNPITDLVMTIREGVTLLVVQCVAYGEGGIVDVAVGGGYGGSRARFE